MHPDGDQKHQSTMILPCFPPWVRCSWFLVPCFRGFFFCALLPAFLCTSPHSTKQPWKISSGGTPMQQHTWNIHPVPISRLVFSFFVPCFYLVSGMKNMLVRTLGPFVMQDCLCCDWKQNSFITDFFELQFETASLIIPSLRKIKARSCKQRLKSDLFRYYLVHGTIYMQYYYTVSSSVPV